MSAIELPVVVNCALPPNLPALPLGGFSEGMTRLTSTLRTVRSPLVLMLFPRVHVQIEHHATAADAEVERFQLHHAIMKIEDRIYVVKREVGRLEMFSTYMHHGIGDTQPLEFVRTRAKDAFAGIVSRHFPILIVRE